MMPRARHWLRDTELDTRKTFMTQKNHPARKLLVSVLRWRLRQPLLLGATLWLALIGSAIDRHVAGAQEPSEVQAEPLQVEETAPLAFDREQYLAAFNEVWETVRDTHWEEDLITRVWIPAREKYLPQMEQVESREEATNVLMEMLGELKQSHFAILPAEAYAAANEVKMQGGEGWSGVSFKSIDNQFVATKVVPGSPAANAGIEVGWVLEEVQLPKIAEPVTAAKMRDMAENIRKVFGMREDTALSILATELMGGEIGQNLELQMLDNADRPRRVKLQLAQGPGVAAQFGHFPTIYVTFEYRQLPEQVGYISFCAFFDALRLSREFQTALLDEHNARGIVIDLRGNPGGMVLLVQGMSGWFVDKPHSLGSMHFKTNTLKLQLNPRKPRYDKPVAILVDECSVSSAELFPGGLQEIGVARIFGSRTAGQVIPSQVVKLPTGDGFQYAFAGLESSSGYVWEGNGVQPDEPIALTRQSLQQDPDPVLSAALKWLKEQPRK